MYPMTALWFESALLPDGWARQVRITAPGGRIGEVTRGVPAGAGDERHAIGLPGLPNLHSHAFQRGIAGLTETRGPGADSFWSWRELMYRFVERLDPDDFEALATLCFAEMLESGFTHVGEFHYLHHQPDGAPYAAPGELAARIAAAAATTGIGLTLLPVFYAHGGFGGAAPAPRQRRFINDPDGFGRIVAASRDAVRGLAGSGVGIAPHSLRAATPAELTAVAPLAAGGPIHIHIAEQVREVEECVAWSGQRPVEWLLGSQPVDERWCLVHATHVTPAETAGIAARRAVVGLCPITEASLGDGIFPAAEFLGASGRIGVGSDSNIEVDAAAELRLLEYGQRLAQRARNVLAAGPGDSTGRRLYESALAGGAQALRAGAARPGEGFVPGASLDAVTLDARHPALIERQGDALLDSWIFCGGRAVIDCVWRAGRKVVSGGRHLERERIGARYARMLRRVLA